MPKFSPKNVILLSAFAIIFLSYSANPPQGSTGAPGENTCASVICHSGNNILIQGELEIIGLPAVLAENATYPLTIRMQQTSGPPQRGGLQMTVLDNENNSYGLLGNPGSSSTISEFNGRTYFEHQPAKTFGADGMLEYSVNWTSPDDLEAQAIIFYLAANFSNGNAARTGDRIITFRDTVFISSPDTLEARVEIYELGCLTGDSTRISLDTKGGAGPYVYRWADGFEMSSRTVEEPGSYAVTITDQNGDSIVVLAEVDSTQLPVIELTDSLNIFLDANGLMEEVTLDDLKINVNPGCLERFTLSITQPVFNCQTGMVTPVAVAISDSLSHTGTITIPTTALDTFPPLILCVQNQLNISTCAPFSYPVPNAKDNCENVQIQLISGLGPNKSFPEGIHFEIYEAIDFGGNRGLCTITIKNVLTVDLDLAIQDVLCMGDSNGAIEVTASGPNAPYSSGITEDLFPPENLSPGAYDLFVVDNSGCEFTRRVVIEEPEELRITDISTRNATNADSGDGKIEVIIDGGSLPYTFRWYTEDELFSTEEDLDLLFPGTYLLEVEDLNGCTTKTDSITIETITAINDPAIAPFFAIYPNPTNEYLNIKVDETKIRIEEIEIFDLSGKSIWKKLPTTELTYYTDHLKPGVYILKIRFNGSELLTEKLVKIH